jgi:2-aminoethylphosphonate-pyruvate transaminase
MPLNPNNPLKTAAILAAGLGSRLKERTKLKPKGFLEIEGISLIERSLQKLVDCGITHIIIGTGYLSEVYDEFATYFQQKHKHIKITCIRNPIFAETGSMYTLYMLKEVLKEDFLLLESDLLYDRKGLEVLIQDKTPDIILASGFTGSQDEVYIEFDKEQNLVNMSKKPAQLNRLDAELVGISKVSYSTYLKMIAFSENLYKTSLQAHYEDVFVGISQEKKLFIKKLEDYAWCEIDDEQHLNRALSKVLPSIKERERS